MINCKDELALFLRKKYGYNLIKLPKEGILPLQLLIRRNEGIVDKIKNLFLPVALDDSHSYLENLLKSSTKTLPKPKKRLIPNSLKGRKSSKISSAIAIKLFDNFFSSLAETSNEEEVAVKQQFESIFKSHNSWEFMFDKNSITYSVDLINLDSYLSNSKLIKDISENTINQLMLGDIFVITSVLMSNSFSIIEADDNDFLNKISLEKLKKLITSDVGLNISKENNSEIKFKGRNLLTFGFQAAQLYFREPKFSNGLPYLSLRPKDNLTVRGNEDIVDQYFISNETFVDL